MIDRGREHRYKPAPRRRRSARFLLDGCGYENLFGQARRSREEVGADRRQRPRRRPPRFDRRPAAARQTQADLHAACRCGDNVIVINADKIVLTGRKVQKKIYYKHTGYIGGIKERSAQGDPRRPLPGAHRREGRRAHAAARPARPPAVRQSAGLSADKHPHEAQQPEKIDIGAHESQE